MLINIHDNMLQKAHIFSIKNTQYFIDLLKKSYSYIIDIKMFRCDYNEMQVYYNTDVVWTALPVLNFIAAVSVFNGLQVNTHLDFHGCMI